MTPTDLELIDARYAASGRAASDRGPSEGEWDRLVGRALTGAGVWTHFQPIVDLSRLVVVGYEGLARFDGPTGVGPDRWFAAARARGIEAELDAVALSSALAHRRDLPANCFLSVNVEPRSLTSPRIQRLFASEDRLDGVVLELTEHARIESYSALRPIIDRHRAAGAQVAVDDAGAGYAGLQHVLALRPDFLKLDRALVEGVHRDGAKSALVEMIALFASRIDASVIAEGIEEMEEARHLRGLGVPLAQGYLFGRPAMPWTGLEPDVRRHLVGRGPIGPGVAAPITELVETAPGARIDETDRAARLLAAGDAEHVVLLDQWRRPVGLLTPDAALTGQPLTITRTPVDTDLAHVASRMMNRPASQRFLPTAVVDPAGQYVGLLRVERVVDALARA